MTKEEKDQQVNEIKQRLGEPEFDMGSPVNESARLIKAIRGQYQAGVLHAARLKKKAAGQDQAPTGLEEIAQEAASRDKEYGHPSLPAIFIEDKDLVAFNSKEKDILRAHYENIELTNKQLAVRYQVKHQTITSLMNCTAKQILDAKVFSRLMPLETRKALLRAVRADDTKITTRLAEHYEILKSESIDIKVNKPIEDPQAIKLLKELGDRLTEEPLTEESEDLDNKDSLDGK